MPREKPFQLLLTASAGMDKFEIPNAGNTTEIKDTFQMKQVDALFKYWADPTYIVVDAGQPELTIDWLKDQTPDTWHRVVMTWNYDYHDQVLSWILAQDDCDKGTAARVLEVEGVGHWIGDKELEADQHHLCAIVLRNWERYKTGVLDHEPQNSDILFERVNKGLADGLYANTPILEVAKYAGSRTAQSEFESEDGKIVVAFDLWLQKNGIKITD